MFIYGDVFGSMKIKVSDSMLYDVVVDKMKWFGEIDEELEEEESEEEVEEEEVVVEEVEEEEVEEEEEFVEFYVGVEMLDVLDLCKKFEGLKLLYTVLSS